jgi:hypothetical protein
MEKHRFWTASGTLLTMAVLVISRLIYAPPYLYFFDNANFAFAIEHFDPGIHQPQPPGYPLFVLLLKALNVVLHSANHDLIAAGLIGSALGLILVWFWAASMFGERAGWIACALLLVNPVFWVAGIANPSRTFLVVIAAVSATLSWQCMIQPEGYRRWFYGLSAALGFLTGFRPECLAILIPIWAATGWYRRVGLRVWALAMLILTTSALVWIIPLTLAVGGLHSAVAGFADYFDATSLRQTVALGASGSTAIATIRRVLIWNFGLTLAWVWAVPFAYARLRGSWRRAHTVSLSASLLPPLLFYSLVYVRDADQTLASIAMLCVMGGAVLAGIRPRWAMLAATVLAVSVTGYSFRKPMFPEMATASRGALRFTNDWNRSTFNALREVETTSGGDFVLIWDDSVVSWRQVSYYYPSVQLLSLQLDPPLWFLRNKGTGASVSNGTVLVPGARLLVIGASYEEANKLANLPNSKREGPLVLLPWGPQSELKIGRYTLRGQSAPEHATALPR